MNASRKFLQHGQTHTATPLRTATAQRVSACFAWRVIDKVRSLFHCCSSRVSSTAQASQQWACLRWVETHVVARRVLAISTSSYVSLQEVATRKLRHLSQVLYSCYTVYITRRWCVSNMSFNVKTFFCFNMLTWITNSPFGPEKHTQY
jgi:hypothetical protein